jgi:hypothetical protein
MTNFNFKKMQVLGLTTDFTACDCCGKENLSKTVAILDLASGVTAHFGVVCAASIDKYDTLDAAKEAKKEVSKVVRKYNDLVKDAHRVAYNACKKTYGVVRIADYTWKVNCSEEVYHDCFNQALAHIQKPGMPSIFKYDA